MGALSLDTLLLPKVGFSESLCTKRLWLHKDVLQLKFSVLSQVTGNSYPTPLHYYNTLLRISICQIGTLALVKQQQKHRTPLSSLETHLFSFHHLIMFLPN